MLKRLLVPAINIIKSYFNRYSDYFKLAVWPLDLEYFAILWTMPLEHFRDVISQNLWKPGSW